MLYTSCKHFNRDFFVVINYTSVKSIWGGIHTDTRSQSIYIEKDTQKVIMKPILLRMRFASSSSFIDFTCGSLAMWQFFCSAFHFFSFANAGLCSIHHLKHKMVPTADHSKWYWIWFCFLNDQKIHNKLSVAVLRSVTVTINLATVYLMRKWRTTVRSTYECILIPWTIGHANQQLTEIYLNWINTYCVRAHVCFFSAYVAKKECQFQMREKNW